GGLLWLVVSQSNYEGTVANSPYLLGASAAAFGILAYFCAQRPNETITLLLFFVIPCRLKPKWVLWGFLGISVYGLIFSEIYGSNPGLGSKDGIAHSAHLGGLLAGILYYRMHVTGGLAGSSIPTIKVKRPAWMKVGSEKNPVAPANYTVNFSSRETVQAEVDRILDKINDHGFGALTDEEKKTLDRAKNILNK
ncbi:MAG: rhomboid family intramembrane serine protease, partial [Opitutales bacterium]